MTSVLTEFICRVFVNIFTAVWAESQLEEAITLIFICKSEINDCGYPTPATNGPVTVIIRLHLSACFTIYCLFAFHMNFLEKLRFSQNFPIYGNPASMYVLSGFILAPGWWHHELIQDGSGVLAESVHVRQCYGNVWMAMGGKLWPGDMRQPWHNSDSRDSH